MEKHFSKLKLISIALLLLILSAAYAPIGIVFARYKVWLNVIELLHNQEFLNAFKFTIFQATLSALFSLIFGVIFGFSILFLLKNKSLSLIKSFLMVPFLMPPLFVVIGMMNSLPNKILYTYSGILIIHCYFNIPFISRTLIQALNSSSIHLEEVSLTLGFSPIKTFKEITIKKLTPHLSYVTGLIFLFCYTSQIVPLILGGPGTTTIETLIYQKSRIDLDISTAIAISFFQIVITYLIFIPTEILGRRYSKWESQSIKGNELSNFFKSNKLNIPTQIIFLFFIVFTLLPLIGAFKDSWKIASSSTPLLSSALIRGMQVSFFSGIFGLLISFFIALLFILISPPSQGRGGSFSSIFESAIFIPLGISGFIFGLSYHIFYTHYFWGENFVIKYILLGMMNGATLFPFAYQGLKPYFNKITQSQKETHSIYSNKSSQFLISVILPAIRPGLILTGILVFILNLSEFTTVLMVSDQNFYTIPIYIYKLLASYRFEESSTLSFFYIAIIGYIIYKVEKKTGI